MPRRPRQRHAYGEHGEELIAHHPRPHLLGSLPPGVAVRNQQRADGAETALPASRSNPGEGPRFSIAVLTSMPKATN